MALVSRRRVSSPARSSGGGAATARAGVAVAGGVLGAEAAAGAAGEGARGATVGVGFAFATTGVDATGAGGSATAVTAVGGGVFPCEVAGAGLASTGVAATVSGGTGSTTAQPVTTSERSAPRMGGSATEPGAMEAHGVFEKHRSCHGPGGRRWSHPPRFCTDRTPGRDAGERSRPFAIANAACAMGGRCKTPSSTARPPRPSWASTPSGAATCSTLRGRGASSPTPGSPTRRSRSPTPTPPRPACGRPAASRGAPSTRPRWTPTSPPWTSRGRFATWRTGADPWAGCAGPTSRGSRRASRSCGTWPRSGWVAARPCPIPGASSPPAARLPSRRARRRSAGAWPSCWRGPAIPPARRPSSSPRSTPGARSASCRGGPSASSATPSSRCSRRGRAATWSRTCLRRSTACPVPTSGSSPSRRRPSPAP